MVERKPNMPTYIHSCTNPECLHEWEDEYSIKADPPKVCPKCNQETAKRMISGGSGKGIVELTGLDLQTKIKEDARKLSREAGGSDRVLANLIGEDRFHQIQTAEDRKPRRRR